MYSEQPDVRLGKVLNFLSENPLVLTKGYGFFPEHDVPKQKYDAKFNLIHEFGHAMGLGDEYSSNIVSPYTDTPNCDTEGCSKWCSGDLNTDTPCYENYRLMLECQKGVNTNDEKSDCEAKYSHNPSFPLELGTGLDACNLGTGCEEGTGCYYQCGGQFAFKPSLGNLMESIRGGLFQEIIYRYEFDLPSKRAIQEKIDELTE